MITKLPIAVIDQDPEQRSALVEMLSRVPEVRLVCACGTAELATPVLVQDPPKIVMMGVTRSGRSAPKSIASLKDAVPGLLILIVASQKSSYGAFEALTSGASGYLLRRDLPGRLYGALVDVLCGGYPISSLAARDALMPVLKANEEGPKSEFALTKRELDCLRLVSEGKLAKEIADELDIGCETVRTHIKRLYKKLNVRSRAEAILKYLASENSRNPNRAEAESH